jgi:hypothetical protein
MLRWPIALMCLWTSWVDAHTVIVYPGWRGNTLHTNGTVTETNGLGIAPAGNGSLLYPNGMQWAYPCGGLPVAQNRTKWPVRGGAVSFQPGWFTGHKTALIYINLGIGTIPLNMSLPMVPPFQIVGPTKNPYPGTFCIPQVPLPDGLNVSIGDNATIQVIETAIHGAALYSCVDITFADPSEVAEVTKENCFNSSDLSAKLVFTMSTQSAATSLTLSRHPGLTLIPFLLISMFAVLL